MRIKFEKKNKWEDNLEFWIKGDSWKEKPNLQTDPKQKWESYLKKITNHNLGSMIKLKINQD